MLTLPLMFGKSATLLVLVEASNYRNQKGQIADSFTMGLWSKLSQDFQKIGENIAYLQKATLEQMFVYLSHCILHHIIYMYCLLIH